MSLPEIESIFRKLESLGTKMDNINFILNNNHDTGKKGLVGEFQEHRQAFYNFVAQYNIDQAVKRGRNAVWTIVCGAIGAGLVFAAKAIVTILLK